MTSRLKEFRLNYLTTQNVTIIAILLILCVMQFVYRGYHFGDITHADFRLLNGRSFLTKDWYVSVNSQFSVRHYFTYLLYPIAKITNTPIAYFIIHLITLFAFSVSVYLLAKQLFNDVTVAVVSVFVALLGVELTLGNCSVSPGRITFPGAVAAPLCIFSLYAFLRKKYNYSFLAAGLAFSFHPVIGGATAIIVGIILLSVRKVSLVRKLKALIPGVMIILITGIPLYMYARNTSAVSDSEIVYILGDFRHPHHYMPFTWGWGKYVKFGTVLFLLIVFLMDSSIDSYKRSVIARFSAIVCILCVVGTIFVELLPVAIIAEFQFFRLTMFLNLFALLYFANTVANFLKDRAVSIKVSVGVILLLCIWNSSALAVAFLLIGLLNVLEISMSSWADSRLEPKSNKMTVKYALVLVILIVSIVFGLLGVYKASVNVAARAFFGTLIISPLFVMLLKMVETNDRQYYTSKPTYRVIALLFAVAFLVPLLIRILPSKIVLSKYIRDNRVKQYNINLVYLDDFDKIALWSKHNTPSDAIFITPPWLGEFRLKAERAIVVNFNAFPFSEKAMLEWYDRIKSLTGCNEFSSPKWELRKQELENGYLSLTTQDVIRLSEKYGAQYIVVPNIKHLQLEQVYQNQGFKIYKIPGELH